MKVLWNVCLKCDAFACNRSLKCSVPASETYPGWREYTKVALCFKCDKEEHATDYQQDSSEEKGNEEVARTSDDVELVIYCAFKGFHEYQQIWSPQFGQKLNITHDKMNLFDPYAMGIYCEIKGKIESLTCVGHLWEISRFGKYFLEYNGKFDAKVCSTNFHRNPLPQGGLEMPIKLQVRRKG